MASILSQPHFQDPEKAREHLERVRWPEGPVCPHCGVIGGHYALEGKAHRPGLWKCHACREQFTVTVGTVFEKSKIPLNVWLQAVFYLCASKKGMSSHQLHRTLGVTYKTAWFMTHRIRKAMQVMWTFPTGGGGATVEVDETYYGTETGKSKKGKKAGGVLPEMNKIVSLVERKGKIRSIHVPDVTSVNLKKILLQQIHPETHVMTDSSPRYNDVKRENPFKSYNQINHSKKEYVRGKVHTNTVEGYFSLLKRGLIGTYHHVSSHHLHRYVSEFDFRYNNKDATDQERADVALKAISGKRLTYRRTDAQQEGLS